MTLIDLEKDETEKKDAAVVEIKDGEDEKSKEEKTEKKEEKEEKEVKAEVRDNTVIAPEILAKVGGELFKELFRLYPVADYEDYYFQGKWNDDMLKTDIQLVYAHRLEGVAPEPPPLEEIKLPKLPNTVSSVYKNRTLPGAAAVAALRPAGPGIVAKAGADNGVAELRLIAIFVAKWKVDPTRTKTALMKLTAQQRRYVVQNFKTSTPGEPGTKALEKYIELCEKSNLWAAAANPPPMGVAGGVGKSPAAALAAAAQAKRGLAGAEDSAAKRPKLGGVGAVPSKAVSSKAMGGAPAWGAPAKAAGGIRPAGYGQRPAGYGSPKANTTKAMPAAKAGLVTNGIRPPAVRAPAQVNSKAWGPPVGGNSKAGGPPAVGGNSKAGGVMSKAGASPSSTWKSSGAAGPKKGSLIANLLNR